MNLSLTTWFNADDNNKVWFKFEMLNNWNHEKFSITIEEE